MHTYTLYVKSLIVCVHQEELTNEVVKRGRVIFTVVFSRSELRRQACFSDGRITNDDTFDTAWLGTFTRPAPQTRGIASAF